jgi:hypothetical protein
LLNSHYAVVTLLSLASSEPPLQVNILETMEELKKQLRNVEEAFDIQSKVRVMLHAHPALVIRVQVCLCDSADWLFGCFAIWLSVGSPV